MPISARDRAMALIQCLGPSFHWTWPPSTFAHASAPPPQLRLDHPAHHCFQRQVKSRVKTSDFVAAEFMHGHGMRTAQEFRPGFLA
jgi:hypothetical protein